MQTLGGGLAGLLEDTNAQNAIDQSRADGDGAIIDAHEAYEPTVIKIKGRTVPILAKISR